MKFLTCSALGSIAVLAMACTQQPENGETTDETSASSATTGNLGPTNIATVNGERVPESLFRLYALNGLQKSPDDLTAEEREQLTRDLIELELIEQAAKERNLLESRTLSAEIELQRMQLIARAMVTQYVEDNPATEAELREVYEENLPQFANDQYKARHILLESEEEAQEVIGLLDEGADFAEAAQEHSTGPTAPDGGDLGYFTAESMVEPFSNAVQGMEVGSYTSQPVQTQFGYHVILLEDVRQQEPPGLDAVRSEISNIVDRQKVEAFISSLREDANITAN